MHFINLIELIGRRASHQVRHARRRATAETNRHARATRVFVHLKLLRRVVEATEIQIVDARVDGCPRHDQTEMIGRAIGDDIKPV